MSVLVAGCGLFLRRSSVGRPRTYRSTRPGRRSSGSGSRRCSDSRETAKRPVQESPRGTGKAKPGGGYAVDSTPPARFRRCRPVVGHLRPFADRGTATPLTRPGPAPVPTRGDRGLACTPQQRSSTQTREPRFHRLSRRVVRQPATERRGLRGRSIWLLSPSQLGCGGVQTRHPGSGTRRPTCSPPSKSSPSSSSPANPQPQLPVPASPPSLAKRRCRTIFPCPSRTAGGQEPPRFALVSTHPSSRGLPFSCAHIQAPTHEPLPAGDQAPPLSGDQAPRSAGRS